VEFVEVASWGRQFEFGDIVRLGIDAERGGLARRIAGGRDGAMAPRA